jgi:hypothetical protein
MGVDAVSGANAAAPLRGKSQAIPPGLERRGLSLPPGQADRSEGKEVPAGVARRFPAPPPPPAPPAAETAPAEQAAATGATSAPGGALDVAA